MRALRTPLLSLAIATWVLAGSLQAAPISNMRLMVPNSLPDIPLGQSTAPVTIIEYASMTCSHCAEFERAVFDTLKAKYIDTGKVHYVFREFPLDQLAFAAAIATRCAPPEEFYPIIKMLFLDQDSWAFVNNPAKALVSQLLPFGFTQDSFAACLGKNEIAKGINDIAETAQTEFGVTGTPTFFINGEKHTGEMDLAELQAILDPLIGSATK